MQQPTATQHLDTLTLWLMAATCGLCAGANYFNQPLIHSIQIYFSITAPQAQLTVSIAQGSYAIGLLFLVPMGDLLKKTIFIPTLLGLSAVGLFVSGLAQNIYMLWVGTAMTGLFTTAAQVLIPLAAFMVEPQKIGRVVGFLMSGLLFGILLATSLAGLFSNLFAWNSIYLFSGLLMLLLTLLLKPRLPNTPTVALDYLDMFVSMWDLIKSQPRLLIRAGIGAFAFASMSTLFSTMALLLSGPRFGLSDFNIGLIGLTGVIGAAFAQYAGKLADRGHSKLLSIAGLSIMLSSWLVNYFSQYTVVAFLIGFASINLSISILHVTNLNIIYQLSEQAKARINAIYMTIYFIGAASGSALGIFAWNHGGWLFTCMVGLALALCSGCCVLVDGFKYWRTVIHQA